MTSRTAYGIYVRPGLDQTSYPVVTRTGASLDVLNYSTLAEGLASHGSPLYPEIQVLQ